MSKPNLAEILDNCLQALQAGATIADCLTRHADQAAELAPMLAAAVQLQSLASYHLSDAQKLRARVTLRETLAAQPPRRTWIPWGPALGRARGLALSGIAALFLFVTLTVSAVAASQPGDLAYPMRVVVERVPALIQIAPAGRANVEITVAERRLSELQNHVETVGRADTTALNAMLAGDRAAAGQAAGLSEAERAQVADRVAEHASVLTGLAQAATEPQAATALQTAATKALAIAEQLRASVPEPGTPPAPRPTATPTGHASSTANKTATPTAPRSPHITPPVTPMRQRTRPVVLPTGDSSWRDHFGSRTPEPGRHATEIVQTITALPPMKMTRPIATRDVSSTPASPSLPPPPPGPGQRATGIVQTVTALPGWVETRMPAHTPTGPALSATPRPGPGGRATGSVQTVTARPPAHTTRRAEHTPGSSGSPPMPSPRPRG